MTTRAYADGPLQGRRVLDLATIYAGPLAAQLLGDFGAEVIKVEHPSKPDGLRRHGPQKGSVGLWWKIVGRNKRTIGLDLAHPEGAQLLLRLAETADVIIESFVPGTLERWGLGYDELAAVNPSLILVRVTGFGQSGPYRSRRGFGTLIEAMSGFAAMTGEPDSPPTLPPFGLADGIAGIVTAFATMTALYHRDANGAAGQVIDQAILDPFVTILGPQATAYDQLDLIPARTGNRSANNAPRNVYRTSDERWVAISTSATTIAERVLTLVGHPEVVQESWFQTASGRVAHADLLDGLVSRWIGSHTFDEALKAFTDANAAIAPVYNIADLVADPQVQERQVLTRVEDPELGPLLMQSLVTRMSSSPGRIRFTGRSPGANTREILNGELGIDMVQLERLRGLGVVHWL